MACIFSLLPLLTFLVSSTSAGWVLKDDYNPSNFFSKFSFWTSEDPTHGFVQYVDQDTATKNGLIKQRNGGIYMGVDYTNNAPQGRQSVRLTSYAKYNTGTLMLLDLKHMPVGCGTWPAYWTVGPNWPAGGEIDIIEGVHNQAHNAMTLHTSNGCSINPNNVMTGSIVTNNCYVNAPGQWDNAGCGTTTPQTNTYGRGLNKIQGGVYAMAWQKENIRVWFFPRGAIPADITSGSPKPAGWGRPLALFSGSCNIPQFFKDNQIVFDTTFCGDWAGNVWADSGCKSDKYPTCESYVQNNPAAFKNAFWQINSLKVYTSTNPVSKAPSQVLSSSSSSSSAYVPATSATNNNNNDNNSQENNDNNSQNNNDNLNSNPQTNNNINPQPQQSTTASNDDDAIAPNVVGSLLVVPTAPSLLRGKNVVSNNVPAPTSVAITASNPGQSSGDQKGGQASGKAQGGASAGTPGGAGVSGATTSSSSAMNVVVGDGGKLMLGPSKRDAGAEAVDMDMEKQVPVTAPVTRPMFVTAREEPVGEHAEEEVNEEVLEVLAREKRRKGRHGHLKRHVRPVELRGGVFVR
ncbi:hypothetical protein B9Z65_4450 [Elsinoe australis]|uniref:endo-1,3(4)-beta-glucanase n=1 Tax=Elsinoe australis TaxID=40998 RepID=A0A2P7Z2T7_9PEZI|nr:hypothetical protein B9Z65_4450 [Elsinoe australis]